jgi:hypothetical protein
MASDIQEPHEKDRVEKESPSERAEGEDDLKTQDEKEESERTLQGREGEEAKALTRDELYERARKLGIEGRSKMTKSELARAVRARG